MINLGREGYLIVSFLSMEEALKTSPIIPLIPLLGLVLFMGCENLEDRITAAPANELNARLHGEALANFNMQSGKFDLPEPNGVLRVGEVRELAEMLRTSPLKGVWFGQDYERVTVCGIHFSHGLFEPAIDRSPNSLYDDAWIVEYCTNGKLVRAAGIPARMPVPKDVNELFRSTSMYPNRNHSKMLTAEEAATLLLDVVDESVLITGVPRLTHTDSQLGVFVYYSRWEFPVIRRGAPVDSAKTYYVGRYIDQVERANTIPGWLILEPDGHSAERSFDGRIPTGPSRYKPLGGRP